MKNKDTVFVMLRTDTYISADRYYKYYKYAYNKFDMHVDGNIGNLIQIWSRAWVDLIRTIMTDNYGRMWSKLRCT